jgi:GT2 family glycosyltransferase
VASAFSRDRIQASLRAAAEAGFDAVAFSPTWYATSTDGDDLAPRPLVTVNDALLLEASQAASRLGLATMLKPHVDIAAGSPWRGMIEPRQPERWWRRYCWMIQHYAELAERAGASTFVVGTELERLTRGAYEERWRELIGGARARFSGTLTYATNELHDVDRVGFWDALDCIGLSLYPTLAPEDAPKPPRAALRQAWAGPLSAARVLRERWELPVLIAEIGFRSSTGGLYHPWDWQRSDQPDPSRQAAAYEASYEILSAEGSIAGIYWWDWPADLARAADDPTSYTAYGKPAGDVARRWNRRLAGGPVRAPALQPLASVVVPVRNGADTIADCLKALLDQTYPSDRVEIIAVDNASTDRTPQLIRRLPVRYVYEPRIGRSHARNRGIVASRGEVLAFTDDDCIADSGWLMALIAGFDSDEVSGVAGEIDPFAPQTAAERYAQAYYPSHQSVVLALDEPFAITANVAFRRDVFARIGGFDPAFVTAEDVDFGWRFFAAGLKMAYAPAATVAHRTRPNAWQLFRQQAGYGYGRAILRERYGLRRGYALPRNRDIREAANRVLKPGFRPLNADARTLALYDVGVMLSLRAGELRRNFEQVLARRAPVT